MRELPLFALLGLICGLLSLAYVYGLGWCHDQFRRLRAPLWLKPMIGGLCVGLIGWGFPQIMGEGYDWMREVMAGHGVIWLLMVLLALKILATGITLGSGNPGGSFAPAVFVGVMAGGAFGGFLVHWNLLESGSAYAIMGMAGLIAGALGAPMTAVMITIDHAGRQATELLLPLMTTVALAVFVMQWRRNVSVYTLEFYRMGIDLDRARSADPLSLVRVASVMHAAGYEELPGSMRVIDALARVRDSAARWFVVRGNQGRFQGIVSLHEMRLAIAEEALARLLVLGDLTDSLLPRLHPDMSVREALRRFNQTDAEVLPVFEAPGPGARFIGYLSRQDALNAYSKAAEAEER